MKKILKISLVNNEFIIECGDKKFKISKLDLLVSGKDIYENIFYDVNFDDQIEITYEEDKIIDSSDVRIIKDFKSIIDAITVKINDKVNNKELLTIQE